MGKGKPPAFQFYPNDWTRDLEEHPLEIEGAWIRICCKLWYSDTQGELSKTLTQWSKILRISEDKTKELLDYIEAEKIGNVKREVSVSSNGRITIASRRMIKDDNKRKSNNIRQQRYYDKHKSNTNLTPTSQDSSSSSSSSKMSIKNRSSLNPRARDKAPNQEFYYKLQVSFPSGFYLTPRMIEYGSGKGFTPEEQRTMFDRFSSHHISKGSKFKDWPAAWQTWVQNQIQFQKRDRQQAGSDLEVPKYQNIMGRKLDHEL